MGSARHLVIYGPPGAGKFTVARHIAASYDVRVLDNHIAVDAALRLFDFGEPGFFELCREVRVAMLRAAARAGTDVVSTFAYAHGVDDELMGVLAAACETSASVVKIAQLLPSDTELRRRVVSADRQVTNKISDVGLLDELAGRYDFRTPYPGTDLVIDNTVLTPEDAAGQLARLAGFRKR